MPKILYTGCTFTTEQLATIKGYGIEIVPAEKDLNEPELIRLLSGMDGYIRGGFENVSNRIIEANKQLKIIVFPGTGYEKYIDCQTADENGIRIAYCPGANAYTVAEYTVALILDMVKRITVSNNETKQGMWKRNRVWNLKDKTLGLAGMGRIGSETARIMSRGFGMKVMYFDQQERTDVEQETGAVRTDLSQVCANADVLAVLVSYNKETIGIIGKEQISLMKPHAVLINTARAEMVDGAALKEALQNGQIAGAAFDVYYQEPAPSKESDPYGLLMLPDEKFLLTPHTAFCSEESVEQVQKMILENLTDVFAGNKPKYPVPVNDPVNPGNF